MQHLLKSLELTHVDQQMRWGLILEPGFRHCRELPNRIDFADVHSDNIFNEQPGDPRPAHHHTDALAGAQCWH